MGTVLDWVHNNKKWLGLALALGSAAAHYFGDDKLEHIILYVGTITGVGILPSGPNNPLENVKS